MHQNKNGIIILTGAIRSGKTTLLQAFVAANEKCAGFLTPDENTRRILINIVSAEAIVFEEEVPNNESVSIGKFYFSKAAFKYAATLMEEESDGAFFIVDEVGRLETEHNAGLEPALGKLIKKYQVGERQGILILVIRDVLLEKAVDKYKLFETEIFDLDQFRDNFKL